MMNFFGSFLLLALLLSNSPPIYNQEGGAQQMVTLHYENGDSRRPSLAMDIAIDEDGNMYNVNGHRIPEEDFPNVVKSIPVSDEIQAVAFRLVPKNKHLSHDVVLQFVKRVESLSDPGTRIVIIRAQD
jgi:hypothetical protein